MITSCGVDQRIELNPPESLVLTSAPPFPALILSTVANEGEFFHPDSSLKQVMLQKCTNCTLS